MVEEELGEREGSWLETSKVKFNMDGWWVGGMRPCHTVFQLLLQFFYGLKMTGLDWELEPSIHQLICTRNT